MLRVVAVLCLVAVASAASFGRQQAYQLAPDSLDQSAATGSSQYSPAGRQQRQAGGYGRQQGGRPNYLDADESPKPYAFEFESQGEDGGFSSRKETGDANGRIVGTYVIRDADGRVRTVEYEADENGYRAVVRTNEYGTESKNPADVIIESSAPTALELAYQAGPSGGAPKPAGGRGRY